MTSEAARNAAASRLLSMGRKDYSDWDATFVAPLSATVPLEMGGLRLDQALARLFHQYSRSRLQEWLRTGHIKVDGQTPPGRMAVSGGEQIVVTPPQLPEGAAPRGRDPKARTRMAVTHRGKPARTTYKVLERFGRAALVECRLDTGRTHQIRVHFQHIHHPVVGDTVYTRGKRHGIEFPRQAL